MVCYRHAGREAYVRCQRCEQVICPECQVSAAVGFQCPPCAGVTWSGGAGRVINIGGRPSAGASAMGRVRALAGSSRVVTLSLMALTVLVWVLQVLPGSEVTRQLYYTPLLVEVEPWRALTAGFAHSADNPLHLAFNMYSLFIFGSQLEQLLGKGRFLALYLVSLLGGSAAVTWLSEVHGATLGASGAIFGLMGAFFVIVRKLGGNQGQIMGLVAINVALGFFLPGISWQAHLGGLATGALIALVYVNTRQSSQRAKQILGVVAVSGLVLLVLAAGYYLRIFPLITWG